MHFPQSKSAHLGPAQERIREEDSVGGDSEVEIKKLIVGAANDL